MKKIFKLLVTTTLLVMLFACDVTFLIPEEEHKITITNNTGYTLSNMYVIPYDEYTYLGTNYSSYTTFFYLYSSKYKNILSSNLNDGDAVVIDFDDFSGTYFKIVTYEPYTSYHPYVYAITIDSTMKTASIDYYDNIAD